MANSDRSPSHRLMFEESIEKTPYAYGFYSALRRIECLHDDVPRLGETFKPADDPVRLGQKITMAFPSSTLASYKCATSASAPRLESNFFGLFGSNGPLPLHITEYALEREIQHKDLTLKGFADIFHHRLFSLFYRAWADGQPTVGFDRREADQFGMYVRAFAGYGMPSLANRDAFPDVAKNYFSGRLANQAKNPEGLLTMIKSFFNVEASLEEFVGEWLELPEQYHCCLGGQADNCTLGVSLTIGASVWECGQKFRLRIGPLSLKQYEVLLPAGESMKRLVALVRNYLGDQFNWDAVLVLKREDVPQIGLGGYGQLGWTTWLGERRIIDDADDLCLSAV
ncbi:MAG: type VI secretion system baseplate subunit TssG [Sedimenticola sp.]